MRFLVDTSVWSLALRRSQPSEHPSVLKLKTLLEIGEEIYLIGVILTEVLRGFRFKTQEGPRAFLPSRTLPRGLRVCSGNP